MISISGRWFDSRTSAQVDAVLLVYDDGSVHIERRGGGALLLRQPRFRLKASPRLGDTPRRLSFPGGEQFETTDNDAVDRAVETFGKPSLLRLVHSLEQHKRYILAALAVLLLFMWGGMKYGVPAAARLIAFNLPTRALDTAGRQALGILDRALFGETEIEEDVRARVAEHFRPLVEENTGYGLQVIFRDGGDLGANALALPDGTIVFTDQMVLLAEHDDELLAVLAHEIGHVVHRHAMRRIVQDSLLGFILMAITGDVSGSSELFLGIPVLLTELAYSREFEREADRYALDTLRARGTSTAHYVRIMRRIEAKESRGSGGNDNGWIGYLSTHPMTSERIRDFEE